MFKILLFALLALIPAAQEDEWRAVLFNGYTGTVTVINTEAVLRIVVVEEFITDFDISGDAVVSPDGTRLAFVGTRLAFGETLGSSEDVLTFADLSEDTCCVTVPNPLPERTNIISRGVFSPDGTRYATAFINRAEGIGILGVVDLTQSAPEVTATLDLADTDWEAGEDIALSTWTEAGIGFAPQCASCPPVNLSISTWDPDTGEVTPPDGVNLRLTSPLTTGEIVRLVADENYPPARSTEPEMQGSVYSQAVGYYESLTDEAYSIIFYDTESVLEGTMFGMNGAAVLVQHFESDGATVVLRDGTQTEVPLPEGDFDIARGTPTGWLLVESYIGEESKDSYRMVHMALDGGDPVYTEIGEVPFNTYILSAPPLMPEDTTPFPPDPDA